MDLNQLRFQHRRAIRHAQCAVPGPGPSAFDLVGHYAARIGRLQRRLGVNTHPEWLALAPEAV